VRRGDVQTLQAHLDALSSDDRKLYKTVGRAAVALAREAGLSGEAAARVDAILEGE
jgi:hypothetical protein